LKQRETEQDGGSNPPASTKSILVSS